MSSSVVRDTFMLLLFESCVKLYVCMIFEIIENHKITVCYMSLTKRDIQTAYCMFVFCSYCYINYVLKLFVSTTYPLPPKMLF